MVLDIANLNTSHVKVKHITHIKIRFIFYYLNTSHVKVKHLTDLTDTVSVDI